MKRKILTLLKGRKRGLSPEDIIEKLGNTTRPSVYNTLYIMESMGLIQRVGIKHAPSGPERARYTLPEVQQTAAAAADEAPTRPG